MYIICMNFAMLITFWFTLLFIQKSLSSINVIFHDTSFDVRIQGASSEWSLSSSTFSIRNDAQWFSYPQYGTDNLLMLKTTSHGIASDSLGNYNFTRFEWNVRYFPLFV